MINDHNQLQKKNSKNELHPVDTESYMFAEQNIINAKHSSKGIVCFITKYTVH